MDDADFFDKCHGSWIGKVVGSAYGMPFEGRNPRGVWKEYGQLSGWQAVHGTGGGVENDDEQFELVAILCLEGEGREGFNVDNLARYWRAHLKRRFLFTAEKQVYVLWRKGPGRPPVPPGEAAKPENNPFWDFIGAQMKGELFGQLSPGDLEETARLARVDGSVAHRGIGVDGEVFVAEMVSQAMNTGSIPPRDLLRDHIETALSFCTSDDLYVELAHQVLAWVSEHPEPTGWKVVFGELEHWWREATLSRLLEEEEASPTHPMRRGLLLGAGVAPWQVCHVLPNEGILLIALLYGAGDFGQTLQLAAMMGYDADCNAGNLGGILGAYYGEARIPDYWKAFVNDEIVPCIKDWEDRTLSNLARRVQALAEY
ncbi:MAG: ADP-ribosylglycohydrolase family protein [Promethearchaeota archaeon]